MLMVEGNTMSDKLVLIDTLERLGVAYHFDQEIEEQLEEILKFDSEQNYDLFIVALRFRLLRQHRHYVSCSVFDKFTGKDRIFKEILSSDAKGLLSLYEAAHLRIQGEETLEEAVAFTKHHLKRMVQQLESPLQDQVKRALEQPLHRGSPRIETHFYVSFYERDNSKNELLLKLAKLDFNYVQNMYKKDLCELSRVVESYLWGTAYHFEPQYSYVRVAVAKFIQMLTIVDDTYDNYATLEEAHLFTEAIQRWNIDETDQLPDYMKIIYRSILRIYDDYEREAAKQAKLFAVPYAKETVKEICKAYNKGLKWCMGVQIPSFEDYIVNSRITSCVYALCSGTIPGMKYVSKETIDWLMSEPKIVIALAKVCRYLDDLSGYEGQFLTGVDFYMKQHGVTMQETVNKFIELIEDAWKDLNAEWMVKTSIPKDMLEQFLGYARAAEVFYRSCQDGYTKTEVVAHHIVALFVDREVNNRKSNRAVLWFRGAGILCLLSQSPESDDNRRWNFMWASNCASPTNEVEHVDDFEENDTFFDMLNELRDAEVAGNIQHRGIFEAIEEDDESTKEPGHFGVQPNQEISSDEINLVVREDIGTSQLCRLEVQPQFIELEDMQLQLSKNICDLINDDEDIELNSDGDEHILQSDDDSD
ncbi:hypothetical protein DH2020_024707 [Rehmannia glutinosa]|uniref:Uncharacterized protein n=1 Tax=Rehmannia glutinosa TaxID=99300 RepID=A0ABR0W4G4_REHGL